jgi:hypothetical protein
LVPSSAAALPPSRLTSQTRAASAPRIALVSGRDGNREIYTMGAQGGNLRRVTKNSITDLAVLATRPTTLGGEEGHAPWSAGPGRQGSVILAKVLSVSYVL